MAFGDDDLPFMLGPPLGVPIVIGASTAFGIVDESGVGLFEQAGGRPELIGKSVVVTIQSGTLPGLATGVAINVNGTGYLVRQYRRADDGGLTLIECVVRA